MRYSSSLLFFLLISVVAHVITIIWVIPNMNLMANRRILEIPDRIIELNQLDDQLLTQLRTKGIKGGAKSFSTPSHIPKGDPRGTKNMARAQLDSPKKIDSSPFAPSTHKEMRETSNPLFAESIDSSLNRDKGARDFIRRQKQTGEEIKREMVQRFFGQSAGEIGADFDIDFSPPEGVDEDELNDMEKKFYSFQKRTYQTYIGSFLRTYFDLSKKYPSLQQTLLNINFDLVGRITFDKNGEIISIKIIKWAQSDMIQDLFEKTLKNIRKLPNPPEALIEKQKEFNIYFQLNAR